jgi:hypothetical protein
MHEGTLVEVNVAGQALRHSGLFCAADDKIFRVDSRDSCDFRFSESRLRRDEEKLSRQRIRLEPLLMNAPG